jgi:hypothetical protein
MENEANKNFTPDKTKEMTFYWNQLFLEEKRCATNQKTGNSTARHFTLFE